MSLASNLGLVRVRKTSAQPIELGSLFRHNPLSGGMERVTKHQSSNHAETGWQDCVLRQMKEKQPHDSAHVCTPSEAGKSIKKQNDAESSVGKLSTVIAQGLQDSSDKIALLKAEADLKAKDFEIANLKQELVRKQEVEHFKKTVMGGSAHSVRMSTGRFPW